METTALAVVNRILEQVSRTLTPVQLWGIVRLRDDLQMDAHFKQLAEKERTGSLSPEERTEYAVYNGPITAWRI
jgi:hypothetical protein